MENMSKKAIKSTDTVTIPRAEYEEYLELKKQVGWLMEQLRLSRRKQYGSSSEKR